MPVTRRSRTLDSDPATVWALVSDPHHLPRWWPRVTRVEDVSTEQFTLVYATKNGRLLRADQRLVERRNPTVRWTQELEDSPFERILRAAGTAVTVTPEDSRARVTLELDQRMRGLARLGGLLVRRAARVQLDEALDGLERVVV